MDIERINMVLERLLGRTVLRPFYASRVRNMAIKKEDDVLDFGCGTGNASRMIARQARQLICLDVNGEKLRRAKNALQRQDNVVFCDQPIEKYEYYNAFDKISVIFVLHDFTDSMLVRTGKAFFYALKDGGTLHICEPKKETHGIDPEHLKQIMLSQGLTLAGEKHLKNKFCMTFTKR